MPALPKVEDVRHARKQAEAGVSATLDAVRNPLLAALGAVDAATHAVVDAFAKARSEATGRAEETQNRLYKTLSELQTRVSRLPVDLGQLRHRLEPAELLKLAEDYGDAAQRAYNSLIERGEEVFGEFRRQPRVQQAMESVESGVDTAQGRLEAVVRELNAAVEELRSRFAHTSRSVGERAASTTQQAATDVAEQVREVAEELSEAVSEAGDEAASTTRSTARKAANRASPPRKPVNRRPGDSSSRKS